MLSGGKVMLLHRAPLRAPRIFQSLLRSIFFAVCTSGGFGRATNLPPGFIEQSVGSGWASPVGIAHDTSAPNNRLYVWERAGKVWIVENGIKSSMPLVDISEEVMAWRDFGLLGVALDPRFQQNGYVYLLYVVDRHHLLNFGTTNYRASTDLSTPPTIGRLTRYTARAADGFRTVDPASRRVLIGEAINKGFPIVHESHGIGSLLFGADGTLLASCGDAASSYAMDDGGIDGGSRALQAVREGILLAKENVGAFRAQLLDSLNGKIIRIDPATGDAIPSNPYFDPGDPRSPRSRVWTLGLRNPYRMTLRPGTGSPSPRDANPGVIYLGDVGWSTWEELHVVTGPGKNCGWPLFEGLEVQPEYQTSPATNLDAPNPRGGYFKFRDLIVQETLGTPSWPNPSNRSVQIPVSIAKWMHTRPIIDYNHSTGGPARTAVFNGATAAVRTVGDPGCPVAGISFGGNTATAGVFFTTTDFPEEYRGTFFHADFVAEWIRATTIGGGERPVQVRSFATRTGPIVFVTTHPTSGGIEYVTFDGNVRRIVYAPGGNQPPVAMASASINYGTSPLTVNFDGTASFDRDGASLNYLWNFDDGTTTNEATPRKTFTAEGTRKFNVVLRVTDSAGASDSVTVPVFVNHAPPDVLVTAPQDGAQYRVGNTAVYPLRALITPQPGYPATSTWQTILHHDTHVHRDAPVSGPDTSVIVGGEGAGFFYENILTVTDNLGLSVTQNLTLRPALSNAPPSVAWSITQKDVAVGTTTPIDHAARVTDQDSAGLEEGTLRVDLTSGTPDETLAVRSEGVEPGQISVTNGQVNFGGVPIGTIEITNARFPLTVVFNAAATPAAATALLRSITYASAVARTTPQTVRVTLSDGDGGFSAAADLSVTPRSGNLAPTVRIVSPASGALFNTSSNVPVTVAASDPDGTVARVDFFRGSTRIGSATSAPFEFTWFDVPARTFNLRARAIDNAGAKSWSLPVQIRVTTPVSTLLADNFDDNARDNGKWSPGSIIGTIHEGAAGIDSHVDLAERNQHLEIALRSGMTDNRYYGYVATKARDLSDASARVEVVQAAAGFADTVFALSKDPQNMLLMLTKGGDLYLDQIVDGVRHISGLTYNPAQHRHWRIRHCAGPPAMIAFETSADRIAWQTVRRDNIAFPIMALRPELSAGTWQDDPSPGVAIFDNFQMERVADHAEAPANEAPVADPGGPYHGVAGEVLTLDASGSTDIEGAVVLATWTFADGSTATGTTVKKTFTSAGTYALRLRVTDDRGAFSEETTTVTIEAVARVAPRF